MNDEGDLELHIALVAVQHLGSMITDFMTQDVLQNPFFLRMNLQRCVVCPRHVFSLLEDSDCNLIADVD